MEKIEQLLLASGQGLVSVQASPDAQGTPEVWHEWLKDLRFLFKASVADNLRDSLSSRNTTARRANRKVGREPALR